MPRAGPRPIRRRLRAAGAAAGPSSVTMMKVYPCGIRAAADADFRGCWRRRNAPRSRYLGRCIKSGERTSDNKMARITDPLGSRELAADDVVLNILLTVHCLVCKISLVRSSSVCNSPSFDGEGKPCQASKVSSEGSMNGSWTRDWTWIPRFTGKENGVHQRSS